MIPRNEHCKLWVIKFVGNENREEIIVDIQNRNDRMPKSYKSNRKYQSPNTRIIAIQLHGGTRTCADVLRPIRIPVDVLVISVEKVREWRHLPGTVLYEALHEGKVVYESS